MLESFNYFPCINRIRIKIISKFDMAVVNNYISGVIICCTNAVEISH